LATEKVCFPRLTLPDTPPKMRATEQEDIVAEAYCVKCKGKKEIANPQEVTMKNGRPAIQGTCAVCGTKLFRILGSKKEG